MSAQQFPRWQLLGWPALPVGVLAMLSFAQGTSEEWDNAFTPMTVLVLGLTIAAFGVVVRKLATAATMLLAPSEHRNAVNYLAVGIGASYVLLVTLLAARMAYRLLLN